MNTRKRDFILLIIQGALDAAAVYYSFLFAYALRFNYGIFPVTRGIPPLMQYTRVMPVVILIFLMVFNWSGLYDTHRIVYKTDEFIAVLKSVVVSALILTAATFLYREYEYSRLVMAYAFTLCSLSVYLSHRLVDFFLRPLLTGGRRNGIIVIGGAKSRERLLKNITRSGHDLSIHHLPDLDMGRVRSLVTGGEVEEVVLVDMDIPRYRVMDLISLCEENLVEFKMVPDMVELKMGEMNFDRYFGLPVLSLKHPLLEPGNYYFKRVMDITLSMAALTVMAPVLVLLCVLIKLDSPGPLIYAQLRKGFRGRDFHFFKFRSMGLGADAQLKKLMRYNERSGAAFKMKNDPRVTRVGRFIRKYSIDEIPQLYNVLRGDMSLVGPRPQVLWEAEFYDSEAKRRLNVLPGITGLWQVSGRSDLTYEEMIRLDLYYLENWTPGLDFKILLRTVGVVASKKGAC